MQDVKDVGKRGGRRVAYTYFQMADTVHFLAIFAKNERANFSAAEKAELRRLAELSAQLHKVP